MRKTCLDLVCELARNDERIVFVGSDLGHGTLDEFREEMPERFFMEGISEANVVGMAAGLALEGNIVYVNTIAPFLTRRAFEQVVVDLCLHQVPVRLIGNGGGVVYAPLGPTHTTVEDLATMRSIPGMTVVAPADADEMRRLMPLTVDHPGPLYIRLAKGYDPVVTTPSPPFSIGGALPFREGEDALLVTTGITLGMALEAADRLQEAHGIRAAVLHMPTVKPLDGATLRRYAAMAPVVVTVEEHSVIGGLGSAVGEVLLEAPGGPPRRFRRIGIPDRFPDRYGSQASLLKHFGISTAATVSAVLELRNTL